MIINGQLPLGEEWLKSLLESLGQSVIATTPEGTILYWNQHAEALYGWTSSEVLGRNIVDVVPTEVSRQQAEEILAKLSVGGSWRGSFQARRKDQSLIWVQVTDTPIMNSEGKLIGIVGCSQDITEIRRMQTDMLRNEELLRLSQSAAKMGYWDWDLTTGKAFLSGYYFELLGIPEREMSYDDWLGFLHPDDRQRVSGVVEHAIQSGGDFEAEYRVIWPDGSIHWQTSQGGIRFDADKKPARMSGVVQAIDMRKAAELALRQSEQRFRTLTNSIPQLVWSCDSEGRCDFLSQQWVDYTGIPESEQLAYGWLQQLHPDDAARVAEEWQATLVTRKGFDTEFRIRRFDGQYRWFKTRATALLDDQGQVLKWFGSNTDIDDQKRTEEALLRANEELAQFAYSASHDLQEPLRNISLYSQLLCRQHQAELTAEARHLLGTMDQSARRMSELIRDLLAFIRASERLPGATMADTGTVLNKVMHDLHASIEATDAIITYDESPPLPVHPVHLHQVFLNLLSNAIRYKHPNRRPEIHVAVSQDSSGWIISVEDNGIGVEEQDREHIFGMFKRLHSRSVPGTGMGLPICRRIMEQYGGRVWCEAKASPGARFCFTVPAAEANAAAGH